MFLKAWIPASTAVVPGWTAMFWAWTLFFKKLNIRPEWLSLQGVLSQPPTVFLLKTWACVEAVPHTQERPVFFFPPQWFLLWWTHCHFLPASLAQWHPGSSQISLVFDFGGIGVSVSSFPLWRFWASYASWYTLYLELSVRGCDLSPGEKWLLALYLLNQEQPQKWTFTEYRPAPRGLLSRSFLKPRDDSRIKTKQSKIQVPHQLPLSVIIFCKF